MAADCTAAVAGAGDAAAGDAATLPIAVESRLATAAAYAWTAASEPKVAGVSPPTVATNSTSVWRPDDGEGGAAAAFTDECAPPPPPPDARSPSDRPRIRTTSMHAQSRSAATAARALRRRLPPTPKPAPFAGDDGTYSCSAPRSAACGPDTLSSSLSLPASSPLPRRNSSSPCNRLGGATCCRICMSTSPSVGMNTSSRRHGARALCPDEPLTFPPSSPAGRRGLVARSDAIRRRGAGRGEACGRRGTAAAHVRRSASHPLSSKMMAGAGAARRCAACPRTSLRHCASTLGCPRRACGSCRDGTLTAREGERTARALSSPAS